MIPAVQNAEPDGAWVRGYTFLEGAKYRDEYRKINEFLEKNKEKKILFWSWA